MIEIKGSYQQIGKDFNTNFNAAIAAWEGASKDKMKSLIDGDINALLTKSIPSYIDGLANLLKQNMDQMKSADDQIANNIPSKLS